MSMFASQTSTRALMLNNCRRYLLAGVLRDTSMGDCSNGGASAKNVPFFVPCPDGNWTLDELTDRLNERNDCVILDVCAARVEGYPFTFKVRGETRHGMASGNFIFTCDSRFRAVYGFPISIHDRHE